MRVLFWSDAFWPNIGGVERLATPLVRQLARRGHEILVLTAQPKAASAPEIDLAGARVVRVDAYGTLDSRDPGTILATQAQLTQLVREFDPDLVHLFAPLASSFYYYRLHRRIRCPILYTEQTNWFGLGQTNSVQIRALSTADWFAACASASVAELRTAFPGSQGRVTVIPNGIDVPGASPSAVPPLDPPRLLCLGRLQLAQKGFDVAVAALPAILAGRPEVQMVIAGDGQDRAALEAQVAALGLQAHVTFQGWVHPDRVHEAIAASTLMLVPSRFEPFGLVATEAGASGRACVASDVGGLAEIVADGVTGRLVPPENPAALARAVLELLADPGRLEAMGRAARRRVETLFRFERFVEQYEALYQELVVRFPRRTQDR